MKRQQVDTDDGWTVITHGLSNLSVGNGKKKGKTGRSNAQAGSMPTDLVQGLTAEKLLQDFNNRAEKWKTTSCAQQLESVLVKRECGVESAVCIGIGSFSRDWEHRHRAMWQLVLFISVVSQCTFLSIAHAMACSLTIRSPEVSRGNTLRPRTRLHVPRPRISVPPLYSHLRR